MNKLFIGLLMNLFSLFNPKHLAAQFSTEYYEADSSFTKRLRIGDQVEMDKIFFTDMLNFPGGKAGLAEFAGKYIILDFWTRYCTACIAAFPKMEELQKQYGNDIQILLVTKNSREELAGVMAQSPILKRTKLPIVIGDSLLAQVLFPHTTVPFHVWLDRKGKVVATTYAQETNAENIQTLIQGKPLKIIIRDEIFDSQLINEVKDPCVSMLEAGRGVFLNNLIFYSQVQSNKNHNYDDAQPAIRYLFVNKGSAQFPIFPYYSMFMSYVPGNISTGFRGLKSSPFRNAKGELKGFKLVNQPLTQIYSIAFVDSPSSIFRIITEGKAKSLFEPVFDTTNLKRHLINESFCYESSFPEYSFEKARKQLQFDLTRFFGVVGKLESRPMKCIILYRLGAPDEKKLWSGDPVNEWNRQIIKTEKGYRLQNAGISEIHSLLEAENDSNDDLVVLDETNFSTHEMVDKRISIDLSCDLKIKSGDIEKIQKELGKYGLGLKQEIRVLKVFVLTDAD